MGQLKCKWLSDDFSEICTNVDCDYLADFCLCTEFPQVCGHSELVEDLTGDFSENPAKNPI